MFRFIGLLVSVFAGLYAVDSLDVPAENMTEIQQYGTDFWGTHDEDDAFDEYHTYKEELIDSYDWDNMSEEETEDAWLEVRELLAIKADELGVYMGHMGYAYNQFSSNWGFGHMGGYFNNTEVEMIEYMVQVSTLLVESDYYNLTDEEKNEVLSSLEDFEVFHMNTFMIDYMLEDENYREFLTEIYSINWDSLTDEEKIDTWDNLLDESNLGFGMNRGPRSRGGFGRCH